MRLNKVLSSAGLGSRRAVEELVRAGRVSVGGRIVTDLGERVDPERDQVTVDGSRVVVDRRRRYWLLNKPAGVVTTAADPQGRPTVVQLVPAQPRVFPVGRLDRGRGFHGGAFHSNAQNACLGGRRMCACVQNGPALRSIIAGMQDRLESTEQEQRLMSSLGVSRFGEDVVVVVDLQPASALTMP